MGRQSKICLRKEKEQTMPVGIPGVRLKAEAERRGRQGAKVAIEKTDALVKTVPKLANACRSKSRG